MVLNQSVQDDTSAAASPGAFAEDLHRKAKLPHPLAELLNIDQWPLHQRVRSSRHQGLKTVHTSVPLGGCIGEVGGEGTAKTKHIVVRIKVTAIPNR
ncbi:MAG: hypothetical protein JWL90_3537 [Chthoniobacteraceae bacterium]|nr:hypothetical protein [Chthoniobacteraceae bacterium]